jgi:AmmeMemoRadiSam system protein B
LDGLAVPSVDALATPLGLIAVDAELRQRALGMPGVIIADGPHASEHSLEVHLPFIQRLLGDATVLPLVVGRAPMEMVAAVLDALWGGPETLIVISTDLSHYHDYATAKRLDRATADAVEAGRPDMIDDLDACGAYPLRGLLHAAGRRYGRATVIDLRNSGDTAGPRDRVVGYGAFAVN